MAKIRVLIVDDEPLACEGVRSMLERESEIEIIGECGDGRTAVLMIETQLPDLVFLDVQMPELNGFDVLEALETESMPVVVFVTAYDQYALKAFEVHALDYILKPFDDERFQKALERSTAQIALKKTESSYSSCCKILKQRKKSWNDLSLNLPGASSS